MVGIIRNTIGICLELPWFNSGENLKIGIWFDEIQKESVLRALIIGSMLFRSCGFFLKLSFNKKALFITGRTTPTMRYRFNSFILDTDRFELLNNGQAVHLEPQVIELLAFLIENRDRMVSKEEINEKIWRGRIVSEAALSSRIKTARQVLGDNGKLQSVIRTIHKKGFRFVAEVEPESTAVSDKTGTPLTGFIKENTIEPTSVTDAEKHLAKPAVAILPFANLSIEPEQEYFSDGITADIIAHLSKHRWLDVTARNTTFGYKGKSINIRQLGDELKVSYVVEGSVQRSGNRIRITVHLIDASTGNQLWAERYDREIADIFDLQDEITETIVARLEPEIGSSERKKIIHSRPSNLKTWDCYQLGIYHFFKFTGEDNLEAQRLLLQSQQLDSRFGEAYAWWAYAVILGMVYWNTKPTQELLDNALEACDIALSLDSQNATFYALKARVLLARREYGRAIAENKIAISLNPTSAAAFCGLGDSLAYEGRYEEAIDNFEKAIALSPNDPQLWAFFTYGALVQLFKKDYAAALRWTERASSIPNYQYWTTAHKVVALAYLGDKQALEVEKKKLLKENPAFTREFAKEKLFYLKKEEQIEFYLDGLTLAGIE